MTLERKLVNFIFRPLLFWKFHQLDTISFVSVLVVSCFSVRRFNEPVRIWLHDRHGVRICGNSSKDKTDKSDTILFEALVVHSLKDESQVMELVRQLEPAHRVCLNHRDLSGIYTSEAFKSAIAASVCHLVRKLSKK